MKKKIFALQPALWVALAAVCSPTAQAANWFDLQTVSVPEWGYGKLIGFAEPTYSDINAGIASNHQIPKPDYIGVSAQQDTGSTAGFYLERARVLVRGSIDPDISYYVGSELGVNGYTYSFGNYGPKLIDANLTFSHLLPLGNRFEIGIIRAPGPEGAMDGFMAFNFLDVFTTAMGQLMQPVFYSRNVAYAPVSGSLKSNPTGGYSVPANDLSGNNGFRYPGVQLENWWMATPNTEVAYGVMLGDYGRQFEAGTDNGAIVAGRAQVSYLLDHHSNRIFRDDITGFVWYQQANPQLNGVASPMVRDGFGVTARKGYMQANAVHAKFEFVSGTGNIDAPAAYDQIAGVTSPAQYDSTFYPGSNNRADGYAATGGWFLTKNIEAVLRYDYYDRLPNIAAQERIFQNYSAALEYHFTPWSRVVVDYIDRTLQVPNPSAIGRVGSVPLGLAQSTAGAIGNQIDVYAVLAF